MSLTDFDREAIMKLTVKEMLSIIPSSVSFPARVRHRKGNVLSAAVEAGFGNDLLALAGAKAGQRSADAVERQRRKRERDRENQSSVQEERRVARRIVFEQSRTPDFSHFLQLPSDEELRAYYRSFYEATSNLALAEDVCGVCARLLNVRQAAMKVMPVCSLPHGQRLRSRNGHPAENIVEGLVLAGEGVIAGDSGTCHIRVCRSCLLDLERDVEPPPKLSLANGLWIGKVPWQLQTLTFPEQLLIAHLYPRVFVVKLFPRDRRARDPESLQSALAGNVSTFEFNMDKIADMIDGRLLPQHLSILASVLSVTYVGSSKLPKQWLRSTFSVRRRHVYEALRWLKANNPNYYGSVTIDSGRLQQLPENDVPVEIVANARHEEDVGVVGARTTATCRDMMNSTRQMLATVEMTGLRSFHFTHTSDERDVGNFWEKAYPVLFPYGVGGIERDRAVNVPFLEHVQWLLQYHDRRFRTHPTFTFLACGIQQRRQALGSARLQMRRGDFLRDSHILSTITIADLDDAAAQEARGEMVTNAAVKLLKHRVQSTAMKVMGSDAARLALRSQIWSTCIWFNPPNVWVTINPDDLHDPVAQIFAGESIDMDAFVNTAGPDKQRRARNIARDGYASATFFHYMISTILETLFGVKVVKNSRVESRGVSSAK
ncbi:hypothetical protein B0H21DRAFT_823608 [Amylocystis lapponica]|nr:hypothetical protein B0H21DRAFT_823608 [Amylocystis lapponica]